MELCILFTKNKISISSFIACGRYFDSKKIGLSYHLISCLLGERVRKQSTIVGALEKELICQVINKSN